MAIQYTGIKELNEEEMLSVREISEAAYEKLQNYVKKCSMNLKITKHGKNKPNYSLHATLKAPIILFSAKSDDWDLNKALHMVFDKLENEIKHKFKR